jgi:ATP-dependent RNA helicase DeaD
MNFDTFGLNDQITKAIEKIGFTIPTPIQEKIIPEIINNGRDIVGLAQTGTGKTAAFGLPMIQLTDFSAPHTQGLVLCPTRELCIQISSDFKAFARYTKDAKIVSVYGGAGIENQIRQVKKGAPVIVATPGRLLDLINRKVVKIERVSFVVLDEADEMLNMGFTEELDAILERTPKQRRTWLFSATMPKAVARIAATYMNDHVEITAGRKNSVAANIDHLNYVVLEKDRYPALKRIIDYYPDIYGLIFCRTRNETRQVSEKLAKDGYSAEALHGELSQAQRDAVMAKFRNKSIQLLVATDVAARGLDVEDISHVINYNFPDEAETYTHRSGRTARAGKSGISIALMNTRERRKLAEVERRSGIQFTAAKVPSGYAICEKQLYAMVNRLVAVDINGEEIEKFLTPVYATLAGLSREELIQRFVSLEFNRFLDYYKNAGDINAPEKSGLRAPGKHKPRAGGRVIKENRPGKKGPREKYHERTESPPKNRNIRTQSFFINVGQMDNIQKGAITRLLCDQTGITNSQIGKIEILREFSFFEIDHQVADAVLKSMKNAKLDGRDVMVQFARKRSTTPKRKKQDKKA